MQISHLRKTHRAIFYILTSLLLASLACNLSNLSGLGSTGIQLSQPEPEQRRLFNGITYQRIVRQSPRLMVIHVVIIDLKADGIKTLYCCPSHLLPLPRPGCLNDNSKIGALV